MGELGHSNCGNRHGDLIVAELGQNLGNQHGGPIKGETRRNFGYEHDSVSAERQPVLTLNSAL